MSIRQALRELLYVVAEGLDPHEFATAYVGHVEARKALRVEPLDVTAAMGHWLRFGEL